MRETPVLGAVHGAMEGMGGLFPDMANRALEVHRRLVEHYGVWGWVQRREPMHELISTMLSHRTTEADEARAYARMRERFPTWEAVRDAPVDELIEAISPARFPSTKAPNIQKALATIIEERGEASIDFLADLAPEEGLAWLLRRPGVGVKTASLVLLFCFGKPLLPVDTHVHRVSQRVGLIGPKVGSDAAHRILLALLPNDRHTLYAFHINTLRHGQRVCVWGEPRCDRCRLTDLCDWYMQNRARGRL